MVTLRLHPRIFSSMPIPNDPQPLLTVYGVADCEDTQRTREHLDNLRVPYRYVDLDQDKSAEQAVKDWNEGKRRTPTLELHTRRGTRILRVPDNTELDRELHDADLLPPVPRSGESKLPKAG